MSWDAEYNKYKQIWGERPSELAIEASKRLISHKGRPLRVLDIGCGYGRDSVYVAKSLGFRVLGVDISGKAIEMAKENALKAQAGKAEFRVSDFRDLNSYFDVVLVSNLYHLLPPTGRFDLAAHVARLLGPDGMLFLNAISVNDGEHFGVGTPVSGEEYTWDDNGKRIHLSTEAEMRGAFPTLMVRELYEHVYEEPHPGARTHYHKAWILIAEKQLD
jgi:cyclopropane fatty-acyl-phospholipid synthase-like methyltransferase